MQNLKDSWQKISAKTRKTVATLAVGTVLLAFVGVLVLNLGKDRSYSTLFTGLSQEEAQEVASLLQAEGVDYKFEDGNAAIRVPSSAVEQTRVNLLSQGYPKSGFSYDMYRNNAGLMTTESDKKQYTLYDLQDRLGSTIRIFDGVKDAKVTIAEAGEQKYALGDTNQIEASASVVVSMLPGRYLAPGQAQAIKNLIATSVKGMNFTNVAVFDADTMTEVAGTSSGGELGSVNELTSLTTTIENNIAGNIRRVLEQIYGQGTTAISVKGTLNMEKLIQENTQYTTPEKQNEEDKTGLLEKEDASSEYTGTDAQNGGGVAGADSNAYTPRYTTANGNANGEGSGYSSSSGSREWLFNSLKEQRQVGPGVLENTTVGVVITTADNSIATRDLVSLIANSAGIPLEDAEQKITVIRTAPKADDIESPVVPVDSQGNVTGTTSKVPLIIAAVAGGILFLLLLLILLRGRKRRKREAEEELDIVMPVQAPEGDSFPEGGAVQSFKLSPEEEAENDEMAKNEEILNLRLRHSLKLKQNIGEFVDQNPQIAAKLVQSWLRGEGDMDGAKKSDDRRKQ
ncbi:flagellar basal-body MS-ring/collar protein FliF [Hungatella hathewayi]|uniref:flagellar basal-body MS-ring/collar protein FliF n=1 Tax=Hungatella hathewayi TaxID=154046 RepID=UPI00356A1B83